MFLSVIWWVDCSKLHIYSKMSTISHLHNWWKRYKQRSTIENLHELFDEYRSINGKFRSAKLMHPMSKHRQKSKAINERKNMIKYIIILIIEGSFCYNQFLKIYPHIMVWAVIEIWNNPFNFLYIDKVYDCGCEIFFWFDRFTWYCISRQTGRKIGPNQSAILAIQMSEYLQH